MAGANPVLFMSTWVGLVCVAHEVMRTQGAVKLN